MLIPVEFHQITVNNQGESQYVRFLYKHIMPFVPDRGTTIILKELENSPKEFLVSKVKLTLDQAEGTVAYVEVLDPTETSSYRTF